MKKVIVTGSRGFIGKSLSYQLNRDGYLVHSFDDSYFLSENWGEEYIRDS